MSPSRHACVPLHLGSVRGGPGEAAEPHDPAFAFPGCPAALGLGRALLRWAGRKGQTTRSSKLLHVAHAELPWGRAWITSPFSWKKPSGLLTHAVAGSRKRGAEGCLSHPFLSATVALHYPGISFCKRKSSGLVCHAKPEGAQLAVAWRSAQGLFLAFHLAACASIPNPLQPFACVPRGAAQHVLLTVWTSH